MARSTWVERFLYSSVYIMGENTEADYERYFMTEWISVVGRFWGLKKLRAGESLNLVIPSCCILDPPKLLWSSEEPGQNESNESRSCEVRVMSRPLDVYQSSCNSHFLGKAATYEDCLYEANVLDFHLSTLSSVGSQLGSGSLMGNSGVVGSLKEQIFWYYSLYHFPVTTMYPWMTKLAHRLLITLAISQSRKVRSNTPAENR